MWKGRYLGDTWRGAEGVQVFVDFGLVVKLRKLGGGLLQLCGIALGGVRPILGQVDLTEGASAQLFDQFEIFAYDEL